MTFRVTQVIRLVSWPKKYLLGAFSVWLVLWIATGCTFTDINQFDERTEFTLDPVFRIFVRNLGGPEVIGAVISPVMENGDQKTQFVEKGLLVFDPLSSEVGSVRFWPVGRELQVEEPPVDYPLTMEEGALFLNGHYLSADFAEFFTQIGGLPVTGNLLTEAHFNPLYQRYEQFFENIGLYQLINAQDGKVHLLSYGSWMCAENCVPGSDKSAFLDIARPVPEPYLSLVNKMGRDLTGYPLNCVIENPDPTFSEIKVFKNVVMAVDPNYREAVKLLTIPEIIGIQKEAPSLKNMEDQAVFIPTTVEGEGFNVPVQLLNYIEHHGGLIISGLPITRFQKYGEGFRQCFEYLCLIHQPDAVPWLQTQPEALGYFYERLHPECKNSKLSLDREENPGEPGVEISEIKLKTWEEFPYLSPGYAQTIHVAVNDKMDRPLAGYETELIVKVPDNTGNINLKLPPTNAAGQAQVEVPILVLPSGTLVPYQICGEIGEERFCLDDDYVIWENP
jgi:hypothetical protein